MLDFATDSTRLNYPEETKLVQDNLVQDQDNITGNTYSFSSRLFYSDSFLNVHPNDRTAKNPGLDQ